MWKIWTDPELVMRWWGPEIFTCPRAEIDFREGGVSLVCMRSAHYMEGKEFYNIWNYKKIIPLQSIEFTQNLSDQSGNKMDPARLGMPSDFPMDIRTVVTFKDLGNDKTEMTVVEYADMGQTAHFAKIGLEQCADKMVRIFV